MSQLLRKSIKLCFTSRSPKLIRVCMSDGATDYVVTEPFMHLFETFGSYDDVCRPYARQKRATKNVLV